MEAFMIKRALKEFRGTSRYHKHLFPGKPAILITDGCNYIREVCQAYWLFDAILIYQQDPVLRNINFQIWELQQDKKDLSWSLSCKADGNLPELIHQRIEFSDFPLERIKIWVIDRIALLPSEY